MTLESERKEHQHRITTVGEKARADHIERVEEGAGMENARMIIGDANNIWTWDGGECQPVRSFHLMAPEFTLISPQWW